MMNRKLLVILASIFAATSGRIENNDGERINWLNGKPFQILMSWYLKHECVVTLRVVHNRESEFTYRLYSSKLMKLIYDKSDTAVIVKDHLIQQSGYSRYSYQHRNDFNFTSNNIKPWEINLTNYEMESLRRLQLTNDSKTIFASHTSDYMTILLAPDESSFNEFFNSINSWIRNEVKLLLIILIPKSYDYLCNKIRNDKMLWESSLKNILASIWSRDKILNIFLSAPTSPCIKDYLFKWNPFANKYEKKRNLGSLKKLKITNDKIKMELLLSRFVNKLKNMNGYPLKVIMFERVPTVVGNFDEMANSSSTEQRNIIDIKKATGLDSSVLKTLSSRMNFKIEMHSPTDAAEYGYRLKNGNFTGILGAIVNRQVDFSGNDIFVKDYRTGKAAEFTIPIGCEDMCVVVPRAALIPQWQHVFHCFSPLVWTLLLINIAIYGLLRHVLRTILRDQNPRRNLFEILIETALIFVSSPQNMPKLISERMLLGFYLLFNVIVIGTFQGTLYEAFSNPEYYKNINTLAELDASGLPIGTSSPNLKNLFGDDDDDEDENGRPTLTHLRNRVIVSLIAEHSTIAKAAWDKNVAAIQRQRDLTLTINTDFIDEHGESLLHIVPECPMTYQLSYMVPSGSFFLPTMNNHIYRMVESGLTAHWYSSTIDLLIMQHHFRLEKKLRASDKTLPFSLKNLQISFVVLALGLIISVLVFVTEIFYFRFKNDKQ